MESKIIIKKVSKPKKQKKDKSNKEPTPKKQKKDKSNKEQEPKQKKDKSSGIKSKGQDTLVREASYSRDLYAQRIEKLVKIAKERIKEEIEETQKRTPLNNEVDKIYKDRLNEYSKTLKKTMKSVATGGPASLL